MTPQSRRIAGWSAGILAALALAVWLLRPQPLVVDVETVRTGTVTVTIEEEGETRAHDRFVVAAPVAGRLLRLELHDGDPVRAGQVLAQLAPAPLAAAEREQTLARLAAARSLVTEAEERSARARAELEQARRDRSRLEQLAGRAYASEQELEQARLRESTAQREVAAAESRSHAAVSEAAAIRAALAAERADAPLVDLVSPVDGRVLRIVEKSERILPMGTPVVIVGDPTKLEAVVDVLSNDAAQLRPGMRVILSNWGGADIDDARVRTVEPAAFTKISALGVEEQRVNVVIDLPPLPADATLGDGYRADARFVVAEKSGVLSVPTAALFRGEGHEWVAFVLEAGRARRRVVELGLRGTSSAEVLAGLREGEVVIRYPSNEVAEGARVRAR